MKSVFVNLTALFAAVVFSAAPASATAKAGVYFPETATLANGMPVVVVNKPGAAAVSQMVWYKVGSADEVTGQYGVAHFLEHLMFKGTDNVGPGEFSRRVAANGGHDNAFTSYDYTAYYQTVAKDRLEMVMTMEADRMTGLKLTDALVDPERQVVWEERRQRYENTPEDRIGEQLRAAAFVHHPYGQPPIGWPADVKALNRTAAETFYKTWYAPNNAILVVTGDVTMAQVLPIAEKTFGVIPARAVPPRSRPAEPPLTAEKRVYLRDDEVRVPELEMMWHAPSYGADPDRHAYALQVLGEIMGGGDTARLSRVLVKERKIASSVYLQYSPNALDSTEMYLGGAPAPGASVVDLEKALRGEIAKLLQDGVTDEELATAKRRMLAREAYALDGLTGPAHALGAALAIGRSVDDVESWPVRIDAVTAAEVLAAAHAVFDSSNTVTGLLLPADDADGTKPVTAADAGDGPRGPAGASRGIQER